MKVPSPSVFKKFGGELKKKSEPYPSRGNSKRDKSNCMKKSNRISVLMKGLKRREAIRRRNMEVKMIFK